MTTTAFSILFVTLTTWPGIRFTFAISIWTLLLWLKVAETLTRSPFEVLEFFPRKYAKVNLDVERSLGSCSLKPNVAVSWADDSLVKMVEVMCCCTENAETTDHTEAGEAQMSEEWLVRNALLAELQSGVREGTVRLMTCNRTVIADY